MFYKHSDYEGKRRNHHFLPITFAHTPLLLCEPSAACASPRYPLFFAMRVDCSIGTTLAPAPSIYNSRDAPWICAGWPAPMIRPLMARMQLILGLSLVAAVCPHALGTQLVRQKTAPPQQKVLPKLDPQNSSSAQTPPGKKRLSQEVQ